MESVFGSKKAEQKPKKWAAFLIKTKKYFPTDWKWKYLPRFQGFLLVSWLPLDPMVSCYFFGAKHFFAIAKNTFYYFPTDWKWKQKNQALKCTFPHFGSVRRPVASAPAPGAVGTWSRILLHRSPKMFIFARFYKGKYSSSRTVFLLRFPLFLSVPVTNW